MAEPPRLPSSGCSWPATSRSAKFDAPPPDIIFFDPFSFKTDSAMWTSNAFRELAKACAGKPAELFTYTYSTRVRAAMLAAGFYVAKGRGTGPKAETTIGLTPPRPPRRTVMNCWDSIGWPSGSAVKHRSPWATSKTMTPGARPCSRTRNSSCRAGVAF